MTLLFSPSFSLSLQNMLSFYDHSWTYRHQYFLMPAEAAKWPSKSGEETEHSSVSGPQMSRQFYGNHFPFVHTLFICYGGVDSAC